MAEGVGFGLLVEALKAVTPLIALVGTGTDYFAKEWGLACVLLISCPIIVTGGYVQTAREGALAARRSIRKDARVLGIILLSMSAALMVYAALSGEVEAGDLLWLTAIIVGWLAAQAALTSVGIWLASRGEH